MNEQKIWDIVNQYLAKWNIINVPERVAQFEYTDFVPLILEVIKDDSCS